MSLLQSAKLNGHDGTVAWVDSDGVGGLPRPLDRTGFDSLTKTMPKTLRFPIGCFKSPPLPRKLFDPRRVVAVRLRLNRADRRALAFDDLQIVSP